jgi:hypothetical protein
MKTTSRKCTGNCGRFPTRLNLGFPIQHMSAAHSRGFTRGLLFGCPLPEDCRDSEEGEANSGVQVMRLCDLRGSGEEKSDGRRWAMGLAGRESGSVWVPGAKGEAVRKLCRNVLGSDLKGHQGHQCRINRINTNKLRTGFNISKSRIKGEARINKVRGRSRGNRTKVKRPCLIIRLIWWR